MQYNSNLYLKMYVPTAFGRQMKAINNMNTHTPTWPLSPTLRGHSYPAQGCRDGGTGAAWVQPWGGRHAGPPERGRECPQGPRRANLPWLGNRSLHGLGAPPATSAPVSSLFSVPGVPVFSHLTQPLAAWDVSRAGPDGGSGSARLCSARLGSERPPRGTGREASAAAAERPWLWGRHPGGVGAPPLAWGLASLASPLPGKHDLLVLLKSMRASEPRRRLTW